MSRSSVQCRRSERTRHTPTKILMIPKLAITAHATRAQIIHEAGKVRCAGTETMEPFPIRVQAASERPAMVSKEENQTTNRVLELRHAVSHSTIEASRAIAMPSITQLIM